MFLSMRDELAHICQLLQPMIINSAKNFLQNPEIANSAPGKNLALRSAQATPT